ncbi:hypothetical protein ACFLWS_02910 [Chloroflexota bacterium]
MKEIDRIEGAKWLQAFWSLRDQAGPIIQRLSQAEKSSLLEDKFAAHSEALERLPAILNSMKQASKPKPKELRTVKKLEESALDAYIKSCEWSLKLLKDPNRAKYSAIVFQTQLAESYWKISAESAASFLKK